MSSALPEELVSVVIATYNMGRYLPQAVQSALFQSHAALEVQIIDDGSTDETATVVQQWRDDPRVRVHVQPNAGQTRAKNRGVALSRGAFVAFLDADDVWLAGKLERQLELFRRQPAVGVVYSDYECIDAEGNIVPKGPTHMHRGWITGPLLIDNFVSFSSSIVRRECLDEGGPFDESLDMGIDYELWLRLSARHQFDFVAQPTMRYRVWSGSMSKNYRKRYQSAIRIMQDFLAREPGVVDAAVVRKAWAHTYTGRGNSTLWHDHDRRAALRDYARALGFVPWYWPAWRALLRSMITSRTPV